MKCSKKNWAILAIGLLVGVGAAWAAGAEPVPQATRTESGSKAKATTRAHRATGEIVSFTDTNLVISHRRGKTKSEMTFALNEKTKIEGKLAQGERATVFYRIENHEMTATRVRILKAGAKTKPAAKGKAAKSQS